jgi:hypothetical protein
MPPTAPPSDQKAVQRKGTIAALLLAAGGVGTVGFFIVRGVLSEPKEAAADTTQTGIVLRPGDSLAPGAPVGAEQVTIKLVDKEDPSRRAGLLVADRMDPDPARPHQFLVTNPDAWIYAKDGGAIHVKAATGTLYMPDTQTPESGAISGGVEIDVYAARADGKTPSLETDKPAQTFRTQAIAFDAALGEAMTDDPFTILAFAENGVDLQARLKATGFKIIIDRANQRLVRFAIASPGIAELWELGNLRTKKDEPEKPKPAVAAKPPAAGTPAAPATPPAPVKAPLETLYAMNFSGGVQVKAGTRSIQSEVLDVWARLLDNKLPENAVASVKFREAKKEEPKPAPPGAGSLPAAPAEKPLAQAPAQPAPPAAPGEKPADLVMTWETGCTILPTQAAATPALAKDHLAMRFAGADGVVFADTEAGASGAAASVQYGLTTRVLTLEGPEGGEASIEMPENGGIRSSLIAADLGTGVIHTAGGTLKGPEDKGITISWTEQADYTLRTIGGELTNQIRQAVIQGGVRGEDDNGVMTAGFARAEFAPTSEERTDLTRLVLEQGAKLGSSDSGSLVGDKIDVAFKASDRGNPEPVTITAEGNVVAEREGDELTSDFLEAQLAKNPKGVTDVNVATARGAVRFGSAKDKVTAAAGELRVDLSWEPNAAVIDGKFERRQVADLTGPTTLSKDNLTTISGTQMRLDGIGRTLQVFGAGTFEHKDAENARLASVNARWTKSMSFDDTAGTIECDGQTVAESTPSPLSKDTLTSERLKIWITPRDTELPAGIQVAVGESGDRPLLKAEAIGGVLLRDGGGNASIESRRFVEDPAAPGGRRTEQLYFMEGPRIVADNVTQIVDVPDAGRMVLQDTRPEEEKPGEPKPTPGFGPGSARGAALLDWDGSLRMDRKAGLLDVRKNVRLTHSALDAARTATNLVCEKLIAKVREVGDSLSDAGAKAELVSATASGAVYVTSGPEVKPGAAKPPTKELVADGVEFDAINQTITAAAAPGNTVMLFDPKSPTPASAGRLFWDLKSDRVEIKDPGPVAMPANVRTGRTGEPPKR